MWKFSDIIQLKILSPNLENKKLWQWRKYFQEYNFSPQRLVLCFLGPNQLVCWINDDSALPILHIRIHILIWGPIHQQKNLKKRNLFFRFAESTSSLATLILTKYVAFRIVWKINYSASRQNAFIIKSCHFLTISKLDCTKYA